jgi:predicted dehydrogenase
MKIGICGTGDISHAFMKSATELDLQVISVLQRDIEKARSFANRYSIQAFDDFDMFIKAVDIVYIGLPNHLHYEYAKKSILARKHVLLEKPVTTKYVEFEELIELANKENVYILEVDRVEHLSAYQLIKKECQNANMIQIDFCKRSRRYDDYLSGELPHIFDIKCGGGALYDLGVYALHFVIGLLGMPKVYNYVPMIGKGKTDMAGVLLIQYDSCIVNISLSKISHGDSKVLIHGNEFQIRSESAPSRLESIKIKRNNEIKNYDFNENNFSCFLKKAIEIINEKNEVEYKRLTEKSLKVIKLLDNIYKDIHEIL